MNDILRGHRPEPRLAALVLVTGVSPFATDTYIAALPQVQRALDTSAGTAQLTMTTFILGLAAGQLVCGPISDGRGRRRMLIASSLGFALFSALCAVAPSAVLLLAARVLEGFAGGCGVAVGRAVISDRWTGLEAAARYATLASITFLAPIAAPAAGGLILLAGDWRTVFAALTVLGAVMSLAVVWGIPETLPPERRSGRGLRAALGRMGGLLRIRAFVAAVAVPCLTTAGFFTYIGGSSIVLQDQLGISPTQYTVLFASNALAMACATLGFRAVVRRFSLVRLLAVGIGVSTVATLLLALYASTTDARLAPTWVLLAVMVTGMGLTIPAYVSITQHVGRSSGGAASALAGGLTFGVGALATPLTGLTGATSVAGMATISAACFVGGALLLALNWTTIRLGAEDGLEPVTTLSPDGHKTGV